MIFSANGMASLNINTELKFYRDLKNYAIQHYWLKHLKCLVKISNDTMFFVI